MTVEDARADHASRVPYRGKVATFYSYKGGVGRTSALAGVAIALALRHGRKVLAMDWDLETPDLHLAFGFDQDWSKGRAGLLEYIEASAAEFRDLQDHQGTHDDGRGVQLEGYVSPVLRARSGNVDDGRLDLLTAGDLGSGYLQRLRRLDWQRSYALEGGFWIMERLRLQAAERYDVVLIDARAGRSDASMIPLLQLCDLAVIVFQPTESGAASTSATIAALAGHQRTNRPAPTVMLVPSLLRAETTPEALEEFFEAMTARLARTHVPPHVLARQALPLALPYEAGLARGQAREVAGPRHGLTAAYERIADAIAALPSPPDDMAADEAGIADG